MYAEGETELRDLIVQNLESCGFLNKIKAEMRAGVFLAFEEEGSLRKKIPIFNKKFDDFIDTAEGKVVVSIVREFLEYFNLNFSLSVFDPEIASSSPCFNRSDLCKELNISNSDFDGPVLSALLKSKPNSEREKIFPSLNKEKPSISTPSIHKSLETISEDFPVKDKKSFDNTMPKDSLLAKSYLPLNLDDIGKDKQTEENINAKQELSALDTFKKSNTSLIDKLKNESSNLKMFEKEKSGISTILTNDQSQSIFKEKESSSNFNDPFFDDPVPSEKTSFFNLQSENAFSLNSFKDNAQNKSNSNNLLGIEKNTLSSLKNLPALTTKSKERNYNAVDLPKSLPSLDTAKLAPVFEKYEEKEIKEDMKEDAAKKELDIESNEESSERHINSDESIEEDLEGDFSVGLDDLLNSSLSLGEDATSDQTVSQISVVDGVDHVEPILN